MTFKKFLKEAAPRTVRIYTKAGEKCDNIKLCPEKIKYYKYAFDFITRIRKLVKNDGNSNIYLVDFGSREEHSVVTFFFNSLKTLPTDNGVSSLWK